MIVSLFVKWKHVANICIFLIFQSFGNMYASLASAQAGPSNSNAGTCVYCRLIFSNSLLPLVTQTACGHLAHTHCLNRWLPTLKKCPACGTPIQRWTMLCLLCSKSFKCGSSVLSNDCDHHFHEQCILRHLQRYKACPVCQMSCWTNWTMAVKKCNHCSVCRESMFDQCSICLTKLVSGAVVKKLPCDHEFHNHCLNQWLEKHPTCPLCRTDVVQNSTS